MGNKKIMCKLLSLLLIVAFTFSNTVVGFAADKQITKIELFTNPKYVEFSVGDTIDTKGISILVTYSDDTTKIISGGYDTDYDFSKAGFTDVTLTYAEDGVEQTTTYQVLVLDKPVIEVDDVEATVGGYVALPITINNNCGLMGIDLKVSYDSDYLTPVSVKSGELITDGMLDDSIATADSGSFDIVWSGSSEITDDGTLCDVTFLCKTAPEAGKCTVSVESVKENTYRESYCSMICESGSCAVDISSEQKTEKKSLQNLTLIMSGWTEGENASTPVLTGNDGTGEVTYLYALSGEDSYTDTVPSTVGTYIAKAVVAETDEYYSAVATCVFTISAASKSDSGKTDTDKTSEQKTEKKSLQNLTLVMSGWTEGENASTPVLAGNDGTGEVTYLYALSGEESYTDTVPSTVGTYVAKAVVAETDEYYSAVATCVFTISAASKSDSGKTDTGKTNTNTATKVVTKVINIGSVTGVKCVKYTNSTITLKWNKAKSVSGYVVYKYDSSKKTFVSCKKVKTNTCVINKLKKNKKYTFCIKAYKVVDGKTYYGDRSIKKYACTKPSSTKITKISRSGSRKIKVVWKKTSGVSGYNIAISKSSKFKTGVKQYKVVKSKTSYIVPKLTKGKTYYVRVRNYKKVDGKVYYSSWSKVKKIVVK